MDQIPRVLSFAAGGIVIGALSSSVSDRVGAAIRKAVMPNGQVTPAGAIGRIAFDVVVIGGSAAIVIYAGDQVLSSLIGGDDPLFRLFYYQIAFNTSQSTYLGARGIQSYVNNMMSGPARTPDKPQGPPPAARVPVPQKGPITMPSSRKGGCNSGLTGSCGALNFD